MKNLVITDCDISENIFSHSVIVNLNNIHFETCKGGLECLKCESGCTYKDDMNIISHWMNDCSLIVYVTKVKYGCFDIPFKRMLERLIVNREPFVSIVDGQTCHLGISQLRKRCVVIGYGDINDDEKDLFNDLINESILGFSYSSVNTYFCLESELEDTLKRFGGIDHE